MKEDSRSAGRLLLRPGRSGKVAWAKIGQEAAIRLFWQRTFHPWQVKESSSEQEEPDQRLIERETDREAKGAEVPKGTPGSPGHEK
jgi:hypothetical protein